MKKKLIASLSLALIVMFAVSSIASAAVWTDQDDYAPGSVVTISGDNSDNAGYLPGEIVHVEVIGPNDYLSSCDGMVEEAGSWSCQITLWESLLAIGDYSYTATGQLSGFSQSGTFTDGAGAQHTCVILMNGGVKCWGNNSFGRLGNGTDVNSSLPLDVIGLNNGATQVSTGITHSCAIVNGGAKCWGENNTGKLGDGTRNNSSIPIDVFGLTSGVTEISTGNSHTCALTISGGVKCWGSNRFGMLGNGTTPNANSDFPVDVNGLTSGVASISSGASHICALTTSGSIKCWGSNLNGQLGDGTSAFAVFSPVDVINLGGIVKQISAGISHTCALLDTGSVKCWGTNNFGQLGDGTTTARLAPVDVIGLSNVVEIKAGSLRTCALMDNGSVKCWGSNSGGQLGDGTTTNRSNPVDVIGLNNGITQLSMGNQHTCVLTYYGSTKCWGLNNFGQLGNGTTTSSNTPVDVSGLTSGVWRLPEISGPVYNFSGFLAPIDNPDTVNVGKSGRTYPLKWQLTDSGGAYISNLDVITSITYKPVLCGEFSSSPVDTIETNATGQTILRYDSDSNQYIYNWATPSKGCYILFIQLNSGQIYPAYFNLK